jgi:hypothetical protein
MKLEFSGTRRTFIKGAAIFSGLSLLLGMGGKYRAGKKEASSDLPSTQSRQGYQLTEHVKKYYETARS